MNFREVMDYSCLSCYLVCPRKFLFQYVLHLRPSGPPSLDLVFGSCWHLGLETAYKYMKATRCADPYVLTEIATVAFQALWNLEAAAHYTPEQAYPKSPARAADMFYKYFNLFAADDSKCEIIAVEEPFTIHLDDNLPNYIGRLDLAMLNKGNLELYEHKTSKSNSDVIFLGYKNSFQCDGYLTVGHLYFDKLPIIVHNLALCQKTKIEHFRHPVSKAPKKIDRFLSDLSYYAARINEELDALQEHNSNDKEYVLPVFRRTPGTSCTEYFRPCDYYDICLMRNNPMLWKDNPPHGYDIFEWDPREHEANMREKLGGPTDDQANTF